MADKALFRGKRLSNLYSVELLKIEKNVVNSVSLLLLVELCLSFFVVINQSDLLFCL